MSRAAPSVEKLPITAIVASHNEAHFLSRCLAPLAFCDEVVVIDIDSDDDTAAVATSLGARVVRHPYVPIAEPSRADAIRGARHDWILIIDPDEELPPALVQDVLELFPSLEADVGLVTGPIQYHFSGRPLAGTVWGGVRWHRILLRRDAVDISDSVHRRLGRLEGFREVRIPYRGDNALLHHWASGYGAFLEKHRRYLKLEGPGRADAGEITGPRTVATVPWRRFYESFVRERGYRDGLRGFTLSALWAVYRTAAELALLRELRRRRAGAER